MDLCDIPRSDAPLTMEASVIVCTHNPRPHYLHRVLKALRNQTLPFEHWELLLIDNGSKEPLTSEALDLSWHPRGRIIREEQLGLSSARLRGMQEASADLLVFVDDDNVLGPDYLSQAIRIRRKWPMLGVWGSGAIAPEFEVEPAENVRDYLHMLALRDVNSAQWSNVIPCVGARPWGAGQCVRADVTIAYREYVANSAIKLNDRRGAELSSGGDMEICFVACSIGLGVGIFPELKLTHLIPKERVKEDYLVKLAEGIGTSAQLLAYKWEKIMPVPPFSGPVESLRVLKNLLLRRGISRRMYLASLRSRVRAHAITSRQPQ
jgi:glycosyltransferase involved in cell wall biosynthesis